MIMAMASSGIQWDDLFDKIPVALPYWKVVPNMKRTGMWPVLRTENRWIKNDAGKGWHDGGTVKRSVDTLSPERSLGINGLF